MDGVDLHDSYRIGIRGKKWWWPLFTNTLENIMVSAWKLYVMIQKSRKEKPLSQLASRSEVTKQLLLTDKFSYGSDDDDDKGPKRLLKNPNSPYHFPIKMQSLPITISLHVHQMQCLRKY